MMDSSELKLPVVLWCSHYGTEDAPEGAVNFNDGLRVKYADGKVVAREWSMADQRHYFVAIAYLRERFPAVTWTADTLEGVSDER